MEKIRVAIIGYGGIARVHNTAYSKLVSDGYPVELVAVCEKDFARVNTKLNFNLGGEDTPLPPDIHLYSDIEELIAKENFDVADVCLPTFLHKDVAIRFLKAGKHVICEKPMALSSEDCDLMLNAARESGRKLMIAHCLRFDDAYNYLKECVTSGKFGSLDNLYLDRHSIYPSWGTSFSDNSRTGGCALDTHIHDIDIAEYILGTPESVCAVEFNCPPEYQVVTSTLHYKNTTVIANGSWDTAYSTAFESGFRARFEKATVLLKDGVLTVKECGKEPYSPKLAGSDYTVLELKHLFDRITDGKESEINPPYASRRSVRLVELLRDSAKECKIIQTDGNI